MNRQEGTYQIEQSQPHYTDDQKAYNYQILDLRENGTAFISPTTSIKRGKQVTFKMEVRMQTWANVSDLVKVS